MLRRLLHSEGDQTRRAPVPEAEARRKRLPEILVESGLVTQQDVARGIERQQASGIFLGQALVDLGLITQDALVHLLVKHCRIPHINLLEYHVSEELLGRVPREVCKRYNVLPIEQLGRLLTVAMVDPLDDEAVEAVRQACPDLRIKPILCEWSHFQQVAQRVLESHDEAAAEYTPESLRLPSGPATPPKAPPRPTQEAAAPQQPPAASGAPPSQNREQPAGERPAKPAPALPDAVRAGIRDAVREAAAEMRLDAQPGVDPRALIDGMCNSLRETMREVLAPVAAPRGGAGPDAREIAEVMQSGVRDALRESLGELTQALRPALASPPSAGAPAGDSQAVAGAQQDQNARLMAVVEAVREAAEQASREARRAADHAEAASVTEQSRRAVMRGGSGQRKRREVAALLGKSEQDALEALEGPGASLRIDERILATLESEAPIPGFIFDTFVVSKANAFTVKVAAAAAALPGTEYNPLFLYGDVGLGKTHLVNAVGNAALARNPESNVGYVSASRFSRKLADALEERALDEFREAYCQWDVLILDDIQFLGGRIEAQEEFFHIFNALHQEDRQIVIAGDRPPDRLGELEQRLVSRFGSGIVANLHPPDWDTRVAILRRYVAAADIDAPEEMLALIATKVTTDIRRMTASLRKILAFADLMGQEVTVDLAAEILGHLGYAESG